MNYEMLENSVQNLNNIVWGWPLIIFFIFVGTVATISLKFVQFRYFIKSWKLVLFPHKHEHDKNADMTPVQAFLNALSTSVGNGSLAGMATAVAQGGPGAAFWIFIIGIFALPIRFCEVYLSNAFQGTGTSALSGGPMTYLKKVPGGSFLPNFFAFFLLMLALISGNAVQANSISQGFQSIFKAIIPTLDQNFSLYGITILIGLFVLYVILGGAPRIVKLSEAIVPLKVGLFFTSAILVIGYNIPNIFHALNIIFVSAFTPQAIQGAILGTTMQMAIRFGMSRSLNATEMGLGTAAVFFGSTGSKNPVENGIMSMSSAFISNYLVCFTLCLLMVISGVWNSGTTGIAMTTGAFGSLFGSFAPLLVTTLSITFGIGVIVAYAYIGRESWSHLTGGKFMNLYSFTYVFFAVFGAIAKVKVVWDAVDIVNAGLVAINLYGILYLMPKIKVGVQDYMYAMKRENK